MKGQWYNNLGICALGISFTLRYSQRLPVTKALLIMPFICHRGLLNYLSNKRIMVQSLEEILIKKTECFSNYNDRFYDNLCTSINAIQFLREIEIVSMDGTDLVLDSPLGYQKSMGKRAEKIYKASSNLSSILSVTGEQLYVNLRVEL